MIRPGPASLQAVSDAAQDLPLLPALFHADRWRLRPGTLFVLMVYFFPGGIVGSPRRRVRRRYAKGVGHRGGVTMMSTKVTITTAH